jgi:hypothetical protein
MTNSTFRTTLTGIAFGVAALAHTTADAQPAPPVNNIDCGTLTSAQIGGSSNITLAGMNVTDWDVVYNGVTTNLPSATPDFTISNIVGNTQDVTILANGFDGMTPVSDSVTCTIPYDAPTCVASQDPDSSVTPVDVGTIITLTLDTTNAVDATVDAVPMTPDVDPDSNASVSWTAASVAISDTTLVGIATNPEGETVQCSWQISTNNQPPPAPTIVNPADGSTVVIAGLSNQEFIPEWTVSNDPDGDPVTYTWELATDAGFSTRLLSVPGLTENRIVLNFGIVAQLLDANGVNVGDSITLFHRATASDENSDAQGPGAAVTLTLGEVFSSQPALPIPTLGARSIAILALLVLALSFIGLRAGGRIG